MPQADGAIIALDFPSTAAPLTMTTGAAPWVLSSNMAFGTFSYAVDSNHAWIQFYNVYAESGWVEFLPYGTEFGPADDGNLGWAFIYRDSGGSVPSEDGYLGFKTSTGYYGWVDVSWDLDNTTMVFHSAYLETEKGAGITIGAVPEPTSIGLVLLGATGLLTRRRRA
jgi:hypothetical protein